MGTSSDLPFKILLFSLVDRPMSYLLSTADMKMTQKSFNFARKFSLPLYFVSAADGTNVVKVIGDCRDGLVRWGRPDISGEVVERRAGCRAVGEDSIAGGPGEQEGVIVSVDSRGGDGLGLVKKRHIDQHGIRGQGKR